MFTKNDKDHLESLYLIRKKLTSENNSIVSQGFELNNEISDLEEDQRQTANPKQKEIIQKQITQLQEKLDLINAKLTEKGISEKLNAVKKEIETLEIKLYGKSLAKSPYPSLK